MISSDQMMMREVLYRETILLSCIEDFKNKDIILDYIKSAIKKIDETQK